MVYLILSLVLMVCGAVTAFKRITIDNEGPVAGAIMFVCGFTLLLCVLNVIDQPQLTIGYK